MPLCRAHFADGEDVGIGGLQPVVDHHAAALADGQAALRASSSRGRMPAETMTMSTSSVCAVVEHHAARRLPSPSTSLVALLRWTWTPSASILLHQHPRAGVVDLPRHQPRGELDDVRFQAQVVRRLGRFQAQQAAADDRAPLRRARRRR